MSPRDWRERIQDIIDSAREIQSYIGGYTLERFRQDAKTIRAVNSTSSSSAKLSIEYPMKYKILILKCPGI
jgi:hypothetical protein